MWMMGYNDHGTEFNMQDSFNSRRLRTLVPRPAPTAAAAAATLNNTAAGGPTNPFSRIHGSDLLAFNHHLATTMNAHEQFSKRDFNSQQVVVSSRWNPTTEQLQALEELYRRGTRTPSADQIQQITAQLRRYGKIEGKNVFYWFQNHKARERQKRRRQLESAAAASDRQDVHESNNNMQALERKESEANRTGFEVEQINKNWESPTNCSTLAEKTVPAKQKSAAKAAAAEGGWEQLDEEAEFQLQQRRTLLERNATWQAIHSFPSHHNHQHLINPTASSAALAAAATSTSGPSCSAAAPLRSMDPKMIINARQDHHHLNSIFVARAGPYREDHHVHHHLRHYLVNLSDDDSSREAGGHADHLHSGESQTLQLFPLRSGNFDMNEDALEKEIITTHFDDDDATRRMNSCNLMSTPYQFFEFLPLKN